MTGDEFNDEMEKEKDVMRKQIAINLQDNITANEIKHRIATQQSLACIEMDIACIRTMLVRMLVKD